jgi:hypothetical protein
MRGRQCANPQVLSTAFLTANRTRTTFGALRALYREIDMQFWLEKAEAGTSELA